MSEALLRGLFLDETVDEAAVEAFFEQFTERELLQEAILNCMYPRGYPPSRAGRLDSLLQQRFLDEDRVDEELIRAVCAELQLSPWTWSRVTFGSTCRR